MGRQYLTIHSGRAAFRQIDYDLLPAREEAPERMQRRDISSRGHDAAASSDKRHNKDGEKYPRRSVQINSMQVWISEGNVTRVQKHVYMSVLGIRCV